ncbi:hypothetical protein Tco_0777556 [Tanacetum coccineum]
MSMSTKIKLTKDDEADFMDSSKYRGMIGSLLYLTASRPDIMFSVCLCARFQENPKTTHLEAVKRIFRNKTALAISTAEAEYVSVRKACQQALWMKQALIDEVPIMCNNKGVIDLRKNPYNTLELNIYKSVTTFYAITSKRAISLSRKLHPKII